MEDAFEIDVDALADGERVVVGAVMQHIEEAGVHSGDAACVLPPYKVSAYHQGIMREYTEQLGLALGVRGLMNVQFALKDEVVCVLEVNPRASRTVPYASKATGFEHGICRRASDGWEDIAKNWALLKNRAWMDFSSKRRCCHSRNCLAPVLARP